MNLIENSAIMSVWTVMILLGIMPTKIHIKVGFSRRNTGSGFTYVVRSFVVHHIYD